MKKKRFEGTVVRQVLAAMVTDPLVCARVAAKWPDSGLFDSTWANQVGWWCVKHHRKYGSPPNGRIQSIFETWASRGNRDEETVKAIERVLQSVSNDQSTDSSEYQLDQAEEYFNEVRVRKAVERAKLGIDNGHIDSGVESIEAFNRLVLRPGVDFIEPGTDLDPWTDALEAESVRSVVPYCGGALSRFFDGAFCRGEFYSFMAPDKTGKSTYLIDLACRAIRNRNNVAYFEVGDGDQHEVLRRMACRLLGRPMFTKKCTVPEGWDKETEELNTEERRLEGISDVEAFRKLRQRSRNEQSWRLSCHPNSSINVDEIRRMLQDWKDNGWKAAVVVIDYADILAPPPGLSNVNDEIDETWKRLRRVSQELNCLVVTATQSNASAYKKQETLLTKANFSGRKTKLAHVNGMVGINVSDKERDGQCARLNWVVRRKTVRRRPPRCVRVAGCFDIENPAMISR